MKRHLAHQHEFAGEIATDFRLVAEEARRVIAAERRDPADEVEEFDLFGRWPAIGGPVD